MSKKQVRTLIVALLVVVLALYFIASTYARYTTSLNGNAKATVAKWAVEMKNGSTALSNGFNLEFVVDANEFVVDNKIAPQTTAKVKVLIDLTGTEVATDLTATITEANLSSFFGDSAGDVKVTTSFVKATEANFEVSDAGLVSLPNQTTALSGSVEMTITLTWTNNDAHNASDTTLGKAGNTITIPVTVTAQQHIG